MRDAEKIVSYRIMPDGALKKRDILVCETPLLSYVSASLYGKYVFASGMGSNTVKMVRLSDDGHLTLTDEWMLPGHSVTPRQGAAKTHSVMVSPDGSLLAAANLGADEVELFRINYERECLHLIQSLAVDMGRQP